MKRVRKIAFLGMMAAASCRPAASDEYAVRDQTGEERVAPTDPIASPDTAQSGWALGADGSRLIYGDSGAPPFFSLGCDEKTLIFTRYVSADPEAKAVLALIGNGHVERLFVDAEQQGERWIWRGRLAADDPRLEVLTGGRRVEATVPGAGSLILNASSAPGAFIAECASESVAPSAPEDPA